MPASVGREGFIRTHGLWSEGDESAAREVLNSVDGAGVDLVRFAVPDQHGIIRGKTIASRLLPAAFANGIDFPVAPLFFDTANAIVFNPFEKGGGFGMEEMQGDPNVVLVPDPTSFRVLPWAPHIGWVLCDLYFPSGLPVPFSPRQLFRETLSQAAEAGFDYVAGLEVEWYLTKVVDPRLRMEDLGGPGAPGPAPEVVAVSRGFQYLLEDHTDEIDHVLHPLFSYLQSVGLPIRSLENEWGPGQVEFTFEPLTGMAAADAMTLLRAATRQICRRLGYHATFMCKPAFESFYSSGWHLHQSLADRTTGKNLFPAAEGEGPLSELGTHFVGGVLRHARAASVFTTPTVNGYRRVKPNSLAPIQASWAVDNRGAMMRVQGRPGDPGAHVENRVGEPAANPYLYMASQLAAGLDGLATGADPGPLLDEPYAQLLGELLPTSLGDALDALDDSPFYRHAFGDVFIEFMLKMKRSEVDRFETWIKESDVDTDTVTEWEQREYFSLF